MQPLNRGDEGYQVPRYSVGSNGEAKKKKFILIGAIVGGIIIVLLLIGVLFFAFSGKDEPPTPTP